MRPRSTVVLVALAAAAALWGCGLDDEDGPLAGLTGDCRTAIHELERERGIPVDVTFAGTAGVSVRFTDAPRPALRADVVLEPPQQSHTTDPAGRWSGPVDYAHSRLSTLLLADALPATRGDVARVDLHWQHPGQTYDRMLATVDVSGITGSMRMEGSDLVAELTAPARWGPPLLAAGAEGIEVDLQADTGDRTVATYALPAPGRALVRIPVAAFTGAAPAPGTQVEIPLVVRVAFRPDLNLLLVGGGEPLPDHGDDCDRERTDGPPDRHDFSRREHLDVYLVARLTATG